MLFRSHVWDRDLDPASNLIDSFISRVRRKIDRGYDQKLLHTVRGMGYAVTDEAITEETPDCSTSETADCSTAEAADE